MSNQKIINKTLTKAASKLSKSKQPVVVNDDDENDSQATEELEQIIPHNDVVSILL